MPASQGLSQNRLQNGKLKVWETERNGRAADGTSQFKRTSFCPLFARIFRFSEGIEQTTLDAQEPIVVYFMPVSELSVIGEVYKRQR